MGGASRGPYSSGSAGKVRCVRPDRPTRFPLCWHETLLTIGHSNHSLEHFLGLLDEATVDVVVDVRSWPASRFAPHFNREPLEAALTRQGTKYLFLGLELGGRPDDDDCYDDEDHVLYGRVAETDLFRSGVERIRDGLDRYRVAIMCSEEDPSGCHRRLLVGRVLVEAGIAVDHIRGDGRIESEQELRSREGTAHVQVGLFDEGQGDEWRSIRSVSRRRAHDSSSIS